VAHLGIEVVRAEQGQSELALDLQPWQLNDLGMGHGGVVMTLLDVTMAVAARAGDPEQRGVVTIEMKTSFLRPARGRVSCSGFCDYRSKSMAFCRADLKDSHGRLLAQAMGSFKRLASETD
jgi:uncharacterized protein (TIGR00369 family)